MFKSKIFKVAYAISVAEGWFTRGEDPRYTLGTASYINHNPGNVRLSTFEIGNTGEYSIFENDLVGYFAIVHQLWLYGSGRSATVPATSTISFAISKYNGLDESRPDFENYIEIVEKVGGVSRNDLISSLVK